MNASGQITKAYGWQPQGLWGTDPLWQATLTPGQTLANAQYTFTATDHLSTPQIATDANGQKVWKGISEAFAGPRGKGPAGSRDYLQRGKQ